LRPNSIPDAKAFVGEYITLVPKEVRVKIAEMLEKKISTIAFFVGKGYDARRLKEWQRQYCQRGADSFTNHGGSTALDSIACEEMKAIINDRFRVSPGDVDRGLSLPEFETLLNQKHKETYERRSGFFY